MASAEGRAATSWVEQPAHLSWLGDQARQLLRFFRATVDADGHFVELDDDGGPLSGAVLPGHAPQRLLTVARAVHCYALGEQLGIPGCHGIVARGLDSLWTEHRDAAAGGYFAAVDRAGPADTTKAAYNHAFVLLAASSAVAADHTGAAALLDDVLDVIDRQFWVDADGASREDFDRDWRELAAYRGANANMHLCEALLAAGDVTGRPELAHRAMGLARRLIDGEARANDWLLPEHYDPGWSPVYEYNRDRPDDPFRPYGATIGHSLEWSRLIIAARLAVGPEARLAVGPEARLAVGPDAHLQEGWVLDAAEALFARAVGVGWDARQGGLVYTVGWDGRPINDDHYWWPVAEGIAAAACLARVTGRPTYESWYRRFWEYASTVLIDHRRGGWYLQFDASNRPKVHPWYGKPDLYHALQASLLPSLPLAPSVAGAVRRATAGCRRAAAPGPG